MKKLIVLVAALAMVATSAMTVAAADWNFYGSSRVMTWWEDWDVADTQSLDMGLQGNARIGATVKVSDELTGGFEYGTGVNVRKLYGEWNFGAGKFLVGQTYTPLNAFYSNQVYGVDNDMLAQGGIYSGRAAMLQLTFGGFKFAFVDPNETDVIGGATSEVDFPAIEASYLMKFDMVSLKLMGGYQSYELQNAGVGEDVDSYVVALGAATNFGAFYLNGNIYGGENSGHLMAISVDGDNAWNDGLAGWDGQSVLDNDCFGFIIVAGFKANDMFSFEAGYGYAETELDGAAAEDEVATYYLQATVTLAPGVFVVPEIGIIDGEETGDEELTYFGAKWQINF